jgi:hypothetical protein
MPFGKRAAAQWEQEAREQQEREAAAAAARRQRQEEAAAAEARRKAEMAEKIKADAQEILDRTPTEHMRRAAMLVARGAADGQGIALGLASAQVELLFALLKDRDR